jgi:hypothetical protein
MAGDSNSPAGSSESKNEGHGAYVQTKEHRDQVAAHVWQLYSQGAPLYTKERLRCAAKQLPGSQSVVQIQGFDGITREHFVRREVDEHAEAEEVL